MLLHQSDAEALCYPCIVCYSTNHIHFPLLSLVTTGLLPGPPPADPSLVLLDKHGLNTADHSCPQPPAAPCRRTWHHCYFRENYSRRSSRQSDFTDFIAGLLSLLLLVVDTTQTSLCTVSLTHTYAPGCQIDYRFSVSNPSSVLTAVATTTSSRLCVSVSVWGFSTPEWRQETFMLPCSSKSVCSSQQLHDYSLDLVQL